MKNAMFKIEFDNNFLDFIESIRGGYNFKAPYSDLIESRHSFLTRALVSGLNRFQDDIEPKKNKATTLPIVVVKKEPTMVDIKGRSFCLNFEDAETLQKGTLETISKLKILREPIKPTYALICLYLVKKTVDDVFMKLFHHYKNQVSEESLGFKILRTVRRSGGRRFKGGDN